MRVDSSRQWWKVAVEGPMMTMMLTIIVIAIRKAGGGQVMAVNGQGWMAASGGR